MLKAQLEQYVKWNSMARGQMPKETGAYDCYVTHDCGCCHSVVVAEWTGGMFLTSLPVTHWCFPRPLPMDD